MSGRNTKESRLLNVIGRIYDAAFDDCVWAGLAGEIADIFDAPSTSLHVRSLDGDAHLLDTTQNLRPSDPALKSQAHSWRKQDVWVRRINEVGLGQVHVSKDLLDDDEFERLPFYQDWCRYLDIFYVMACVFPLPGNQLGSLGIHRPRKESPFSEEHQRLAEFLLPHYRRALEVRRRFQLDSIQRDAAQQAALCSQTGMLVLSEDRRILYACPRAEVILQEADGLRIVDGRVIVNGRTENDALIQSIADAIVWCDAPQVSDIAAYGTGRTGTLAIARPNRLPLTLLVSPMRPHSLRTVTHAALVLVRDPESVTPRLRALRELFGFTNAEAAVAALLAQGNTIEMIAAAQGISLNTVRTHLKNILAKTNTTRQAEAVGLILRSAAVLSALEQIDGDTLSTLPVVRL